jgi:hypothetical protein
MVKTSGDANENTHLPIFIPSLVEFSFKQRKNASAVSDTYRRVFFTTGQCNVYVYGCRTFFFFWLTCGFVESDFILFGLL